MTDRETVDAIQENPYLQFFIGLEEFTLDRPFDASLMVDFRKRFGEKGIQRIGDVIALASLPQTAVVDPTADNSETPAANNHPQPCSSASDTNDNVAAAANQGQLIVDATCVPADIRYPTDVSLLNEAREKTDEIIDELHTPLVGKQPHPRTYRIQARRRFVAFAKHKRPARQKIRQAD